jgi:MSHA biogenesis protein MshO
MQRPRNQGFTLVEVTLVLAILAIVAAIGSSLVVQSMQAYQQNEQKQRIMQRGRLVIEQITRELRMALPASVRTSASGRCIEFLPILASTQTRAEVADVANNKSPSNTVAVAQFSLSRAAQYAVVAGFAATEIYTHSNPGARVNTSNMNPGVYTQVTLGSSQRFLRNSKHKRLHLTDHPIRFCLSGSELWRYSQYGFSTSGLDDSAPSGTSALMSQGVSTNATAFSLSPGSEERNTAVTIRLSFSHGTLTLPLQTEVLIRNVP